MFCYRLICRRESRRSYSLIIGCAISIRALVSLSYSHHSASAWVLPHHWRRLSLGTTDSPDRLRMTSKRHLQEASSFINLLDFNCIGIALACTTCRRNGIRGFACPLQPVLLSVAWFSNFTRKRCPWNLGLICMRNPFIGRNITQIA